MATAAIQAAAIIVPIVTPYIMDFLKKKYHSVGESEEELAKDLELVFGERLAKVSPDTLSAILADIKRYKLLGIPYYNVVRSLMQKYPEFADIIVDVASGYNAQGSYGSFPLSNGNGDIQSDVKVVVEFPEKGEIAARDVIGRRVWWKDRFPPYHRHEGTLIDYEAFDSDEVGRYVERLHIEMDDGSIRKIDIYGKEVRLIEPSPRSNQEAMSVRQSLYTNNIHEILSKAHEDEVDAIAFYTKAIEEAKRMGTPLGNLIADKLNEIRNDEMDHRKIIQAVYDLLITHDEGF